METIRQEREKQILGQSQSISLVYTLQIKNVMPLIFATWTIYLKYLIVNNQILNYKEMESPYSNQPDSDPLNVKMIKNSYMTLATIL